MHLFCLADADKSSLTARLLCDLILNVKFVQAVVRGLKEELGIAAGLEDIEGPLAACHQRTLTIPGLIKDVEFVASYRFNRFWSYSDIFSLLRILLCT